MITQFKIHCFKSIESVELDLGHINVFIGANGGGKSNLLEAFGLIAAAGFGRIDQESLVRRGCRPGGIFTPMFRGAPTNAETLLETSGGEIHYSVVLKSPQSSRLKGWEFKQELWKAGDKTLVDRLGPEWSGKGDPQVGLAALRLAEIGGEDPAAIFLKTLSEYSIYTPDTAILRGLMQDPQIREPVGLSGGRIAAAISEMVKEPAIYEKLREEFSHCVDWFQHFVVIPMTKKNDSLPSSHLLGFADRFFSDEAPHLLGVNEVNEGALYLLFVAALCLHPAAPKLFSLDNADHGLNPLLAKRLMTTMCRWLLEGEKNRQVLMTTQNPLVLDGLPLNDDRVRLFIVDRDNRGTTKVKRFEITSEIKKIAAEKDWPLSRIWVNGLIGGVPNV